MQSWQRLLPDYGVAPNPTQAAWEVHLSHWTGALPSLTVNTDWAWHQWDHLFGTYTYGDTAVYGFKSTSVGAPLDSFGRNVYVDTFDSKYGPGWIRENSFLTHTGDGVFCYSFNPHGAHPAGNGSKYRPTILRPGVTPDVRWEAHRPVRMTGLMQVRTPRSRACTTSSASQSKNVRCQRKLWHRVLIEASLGGVNDRGAEQRSLFVAGPPAFVVVAESGRRAGLTVNPVSLRPNRGSWASRLRGQPAR